MQCCGTSGHCDSIVPCLACIVTKQHGVRSGKYLLKTPGNAISKTLNFKMSLDASALKNLCLLCEFQSHLQFIISLLLKNFLTALLLPQCYRHALLFIICFISLVGILVIYRWYAYKSGEPAIGQNTFHVTHVCNARSLLQPVQCGWLKTVPWSQS